MSLFVLASKDGWVNIMYTGLDAVGVDQQVSQSHSHTQHSLHSHSFTICRFFAAYPVSVFSFFSLISRVAIVNIQSVSGPWYRCRLASPSVGQSVCPEGVLWQNG